MGRQTTRQIRKSELRDWLNHGTSPELAVGVVPGLHIRRNREGFSFRLRYRNLSGQRRFYTLGPLSTLSVENAIEEARKLHALILKGEDPQHSKQMKVEAAQNTVGAYLELYWLHKLQHQKSGKEAYNGIRNHFSRLLDCPLEELSPRDITKWQTQMIGKGRKKATITKIYRYFKTMLNHAVLNDYLDDNPIRNAKLAPMQDSMEHVNQRINKRTYLTKEQVLLLFEGFDNYQSMKVSQRNNSRAHGKSYLPDLSDLKYVDHVVPMLKLLFYTGFRPGDVYGLMWEHVSFDFRNITKVIEKTAHLKPEPTTFPMSDGALSTLVDWHAQNGRPDKGLVFPSPVTSVRMDKQALDKPWLKILVSVGLPESLDIYTLRHNFASQLVMKNVNLLTVAKLMGHSDIDMIVNHYGHLAPSELHNAVNLIEGDASPQHETYSG